jgi:hypothetical protein
MIVGYHVDHGVPCISYNCTGTRAQYGSPICQHLSGACLDEFITDQVPTPTLPGPVGQPIDL